MADWYQLEADEVVRRLETDAARGLGREEAARRRARHGPNELVERGAHGPWQILREQLTSTMVVILIVAAVGSAAVGDLKDAVAILVIVVLNAALGFSQEYRAERAMAALKRLAVPSVRVRRDGVMETVSARELAPGDVVLLEAGNVVPADCRLLESANLRTQEAALTGESEPVDKSPRALPEADLPIGDRRNILYQGTVVTYGRGAAVVVETGMRTQLGSIAELIQSVGPEQTPLQRRLAQLGRVLALAALAIVALVFLLGLLRGEELTLMFLTAVSLAVAAVPEGLPAVVTIVLALGAQRMLRRRALIRRLPAVETLGSVTIICSDKTGTLTENRMTVTVLEAAGQRADVRDRDPTPPPALALLLTGGALCNDAELRGEEGVGDPTEVALVVAAARHALRKEDLERALPRVAEAPFDSERKLMTTVHRLAGGAPGLLDHGPFGDAPFVAFTKGAVDQLLDVAREVWAEGRREPLGDDWRGRIAGANDQLAQGGMRVLGVAFRPLATAPAEATPAALERELVFVGVCALIDPARPEVKDAIATCREAGIRPVMITGDHPLTAAHIARELGIAGEERVLTGRELDRLSVEELERDAERVSVYARVSPEHKLKIVRALQQRGHVVAMTGDGVNDAPALKKSDIGVAMGVTGTDVAKEAADIVLLDDNFTTIVAAVEEGRIIYDNIRKFIKYLATTNSAEIALMLIAPLLGMPLPLLPLQILWVNLVTDGLPALALGVEPAERDTMRRPPFHPGESIFAGGMGAHIVWVGLLMAAVALGTGYWYWRGADEHWQTMVFTVITLSQLGHVLAIRSWRDSLFRIGVTSNKPLLAAVALMVVLQLAIIYLPTLQRFFRTVPLPPRDLAVCLLASSLVFWAVEAEKWSKRRKTNV